MNNFISKYYKKSALFLLALPFIGGVGSMLTSCSDMLDTKSDMVEFTEDNKLSTPEDSLNSVLGIVRSMQVIADRTVLLGEVRADLITPSVSATTSLQQVAANNFSEPNEYNKISDYYAVINNCNYFLANVDTALSRLGKKVFEKEYAVVKTYRAWTYLQAVKAYGKIPLVLDPVLTENAAYAETQKGYSGIAEICNYFIDDLKPYVDTELPQYGVIGDFESEKFFIPVRVLLGELCLWAGRYDEAAGYFYNYLARKNHVITTNTPKNQWNVTNLDFTTASIRRSVLDSYIRASGNDNISIIPMEETEFYGVKSYLQDIFTSNQTNYYYYQAGPSQAMLDISAAQSYCLLAQTSETQKDTVIAPKTGLPYKFCSGDLRLYDCYSKDVRNQSETSMYGSDYQTMRKFQSNFVPLYRRQQVYLMFAEALNRAGYPESAFCILKYGLRNINIEKYISEEERTAAAAYLNFNDDDFTAMNTQGVHARGCGDVECDTTYCIPADLSADEVTKYVEDLIITEMALEGSFEGQRFYNLMRVALRRSDPSYLAAPIARRNGEEDASMLSRMMDTNNWYLPIK